MPRPKKSRAPAPVPRHSPKGRVAEFMLTGRYTFAQIARKTRRTYNNVVQHALQLKARGFSYTSERTGRDKRLAGPVKLIVPKGAKLFED